MNSNKGLTLMEAMAAMVIVTVLIVAIIPALISFTHINQKSEWRSSAVDVAELLLERYRTQDIGVTLPTTANSQTETVSMGGFDYETTTLFCQTISYCDSETTHIRVEVSYRNEKLYEVETVFYQP